MCPSLGQSNGPSNTFTPVIRQPRRQKKASIENRFKDALERDQAESEREKVCTKPSVKLEKEWGRGLCTKGNSDR